MSPSDGRANKTASPARKNVSKLFQEKSCGLPPLCPLTLSREGKEAAEVATGRFLTATDLARGWAQCRLLRAVSTVATSCGRFLNHINRDMKTRHPGRKRNGDSARPSKAHAISLTPRCRNFQS